MFPALNHPIDNRCQDYKDHEDKINYVLQNFDNDELGLLYRMLYQQGYRYDSTDSAVRRLRARYKPMP